MLTFHGLQVNATYDKYALREKVTRSFGQILFNRKNNFVNIFLVKNRIVQLKNNNLNTFFNTSH